MVKINKYLNSQKYDQEEIKKILNFLNNYSYVFTFNKCKFYIEIINSCNKLMNLLNCNIYNIYNCIVCKTELQDRSNNYILYNLQNVNYLNNSNNADLICCNCFNILKYILNYYIDNLSTFEKIDSFIENNLYKKEVKYKNEEYIHVYHAYNLLYTLDPNICQFHVLYNYSKPISRYIKEEQTMEKLYIKLYLILFKSNFTVSGNYHYKGVKKEDLKLFIFNSIIINNPDFTDFINHFDNKINKTGEEYLSNTNYSNLIMDKNYMEKYNELLEKALQF